jgi:hypothetical protein
LLELKGTMNEDIFIEDYRGYPIYALGSYSTAYYFTPLCKRINHRMKIAQIRKMIDKRIAVQDTKKQQTGA